MPDDRIRVVREAERGAPNEVTSGMFRREVAATDRAWVGTVTTEPGLVTGWHHHGTYESYIYVLTGHIRLEFGPAGAEAVEGGPGDVVVVPPWKVHREGTAEGSSGLAAVVFRAGKGEPVFNVDGPEAEG